VKSDPTEAAQKVYLEQEIS